MNNTIPFIVAFLIAPNFSMASPEQRIMLVSSEISSLRDFSYDPNEASSHVCHSLFAANIEASYSGRLTKKHISPSNCNCD